MATLSNPQLDELRQNVAVSNPPVWTKPQINAALQAVEDRFEAVRASFGTAIENAAPGVFNATQKKAIVAYYLRQKFVREGV